MNNNENSNEGLNSISLGSVGNAQNINNVPPVAPVPPVDNLNPKPVNNMEVVDTLQPEEVLQSSNDNGGAIPNAGVAPMPQADIPVPLSEDMSSIPPMEPVSPVPPVAPIDNNGVIPPIEPVQPIGEIPPVENNFNAIPLTNGIGTVPPIVGPSLLPPEENPTPEPKKKGMNKTIFILIIVLVIAAIGVAVYVVLGLANRGTGTSTGVVVKEVKIELGSQVSAEINDYATFNGMNSSYCSLNTTEIKDTNELNAEYDFTVTCNGKDYKGKAKIVDTIKPEVVTRNATVEVNAELKPDDFIESCTDKSNCTYTFKDEEAVKAAVAQAGTTEVEIIVKDEAGNETTVAASLEVKEANGADPSTPDNPGDNQTPTASVYLVCSKDQTDYREVNSLGLNNGEFVGVAIRDYVFTFSSSEEYQTAKGENTNGAEMTYKEITGKATFDDSAFKITITKSLTSEELNTESGTTLPKAFLELSSYYGSNGYSCELK